ncbi:MAG: DUF1840 domain-containing protein [Polynucleobacter sp.]|jgi:hypothetical protein|nr:DUF1840 domain-containing protein [Polynucleobacter sp.]
MIYQFRSKASPDVMMLSDLTQRIFDILKRPLETRGILLPEQLGDYIKQLELAIAEDQEIRSPNTENRDEKEQDLPKADRLGQRAFPFLELLKQAHAANEPILWGV